MYEEKREGISIKTVILQILIVILFVFLLMWLFPLKLNNNGNSNSTDLTVIYEKVFNENVISMKESAKGYFTTERLPKNVGDNVTITLGEMLQKKIILPFVDKDGKSCDTTASYVQVTKKDNEYEMKINLKCSTQEDYLIVIMGCYNYCPGGICENEQTITYQYKCPTNGGWSAWSAWQTAYVNATSTTQVKTEVRNESYTYTTQEEQVVGTKTEKVKTGTHKVKTGTKVTTKTYINYSPKGLKCTSRTRFVCDTCYDTEIVYTCKVYTNIYKTVTDYKNVTTNVTDMVDVNKTGYKDVTYYSYRTYTKGSYYYRWSASKTDTTLTNKGCALTGKTETKTVTK